MKRNTAKELLKELEENHYILNVKLLGEYKKSGVIIGIKAAETGFIYDRELILSDGTSVIAWI